MTAPHLSGWCSGQAGCDSARAHRTCQDRADKNQLARPCHCLERGGHTTKEESAD